MAFRLNEDLTVAYVSAGEVILQSAILTAVAMLILTLYTFWASRRGYDFKFLGPFLFAALIALLVFALIQVLQIINSYCYPRMYQLSLTFQFHETIADFYSSG